MALLPHACAMHTLCLRLYSLPSTLHPLPSTLYPLPSTLCSLPSTVYPLPSALYPLGFLICLCTTRLTLVTWCMATAAWQNVTHLHGGYVQWQDSRPRSNEAEAVLHQSILLKILFGAAWRRAVVCARYV